MQIPLDPTIERGYADQAPSTKEYRDRAENKHREPAPVTSWTKQSTPPQHPRRCTPTLPARKARPGSAGRGIAGRGRRNRRRCRRRRIAAAGRIPLRRAFARCGIPVAAWMARRGAASSRYGTSMSAVSAPRPTPAVRHSTRGLFTSTSPPGTTPCGFPHSAGPQLPAPAYPATSATSTSPPGTTPCGFPHSAGPQLPAPAYPATFATSTSPPGTTRCGLPHFTERAHLGFHPRDATPPIRPGATRCGLLHANPAAASRISPADRPQCVAS
ncbi:hypothetical protein SAMN05421854_1011751 [Amycolatopsis rubida]|uniref:Uncharacterized protein n=1 Tax=Amycolatopsis rubida TaxID=112413 RepID=A0A1I5GQI7_9PSEU|nr:hypothetical protein SAMN05421854_1011751 [Amycolatopsis rubida]